MKRLYVLALCLIAMPAVASEAPASTASKNAGFLSDYSRLIEEGGVRSRFLDYVAPQASATKISSVFLSPVIRFPAVTTFGNIDDDIVNGVIAYTDQQLRSQLTPRMPLVDAPATADATLQIALTSVAPQPAGYTAFDLLPIVMISGLLKNATMGKSMEAGATLELRLLSSASSASIPSDAVTAPTLTAASLSLASASTPADPQILRESKYQLAGKSLGRGEGDKARVTLDSLKPAIDKWVAGIVDQVAPKP